MANIIMSEARTHLNFMIRLYHLQIDAGRLFLHEHPAGATSWKEPAMIQLMSMPGVDHVIGHQCQYGLTTPGNHGSDEPALKPRRWLSNSRPMLARLDEKCPREQHHQPLLGGRAQRAELYPDELTVEILKGMRDHANQDLLRLDEENSIMQVAMLNSGFSNTNSTADLYKPSIDLDIQRLGIVNANSNNSLQLTFTDGTTNTHNVGQHVKETCLDEYTREELQRGLIQKAMIDELEYVCRIVWGVCTPEEVHRVKHDPGNVFVGGALSAPQQGRCSAAQSEGASRCHRAQHPR